MEVFSLCIAAFWFGLVIGWLIGGARLRKTVIRPSGGGMAMASDPRAPATCYESAAIMRGVCKWAGMDWSPLRRMVLVLDVDAPPMLYVESFLDANRIPPEIDLPKADVQVVEQAVTVDATDKGVTVQPERRLRKCGEFKPFDGESTTCILAAGHDGPHKNVCGEWF